MRIMLVGGGSGGHITPLLAVAHSIKRRYRHCTIVAVCERGCRFAHLYAEDSAIDEVVFVSAGKYRRYPGRANSVLERLIDYRTNLLNFIDLFKTIYGCFQSWAMLRHHKPDAILIKGGFVAVPVGLVAAMLKISFATHDSDSVPGLANRIVSRWAKLNMTGMPSNLYNYPENKTRFVGIPIASDFKHVTEVLRRDYRAKLQLPKGAKIITLVGGSLGGASLNNSMTSISRELLSDGSVYILHIAGRDKDLETRQQYQQHLDSIMLKRVKVYDFVDNVHVLQGAADIVISRAGATQAAELSTQGLPTVLVPANLAGDHQVKNAEFYLSHNAAEMVNPGEDDELLNTVKKLLYNKDNTRRLSYNISKLAKPSAAYDIAEAIIMLVDRNNKAK